MSTTNHYGPDGVNSHLSHSGAPGLPPEKTETLAHPLLSVQGISVHYGAIQAIHDISFDVVKGKILTLIGANGAGKTTTLRAISGLAKVSAGRILYQNHTISNLPPH